MMRGFIGYGSCFGGGGFGMIFWTILLAVGIIAFYKWQRGSNTSAIDVLKNQFARGEITEEDYLKRKEVLKQK